MDKDKCPSVRKRKIVMGMDGSHNAENAFKWFVEKIHQQGDYLILIHIPEYIKMAAIPVMTADPALMTRIVEEQQHETKVAMSKFDEMLKQNNIEGTVKQMHGIAGEQLVSAANLEEADFILTGSRGLGTIRRTFLGSVSDYVLHHSPVPVLVWRHGHH